MDDEIVWASAVELAERIRRKSVEHLDGRDAHLGRIQAVNPRLKAMVTVVEAASERARAAEKAVMAGRRIGPLHGVPFTIKDCIDTAGILTTRGSLLFKDYVPESNATVVDRLERAGGVLMAKTNLPEFAMDAESSNRVFGRTVNPWNPERTPCGSSGGEAAGLAAGLSPLGVGSDVGGSIRVPATFCGIAGLKATHGRIPLTGHWPDTLLRWMHVGPMARTVGDVALGLRILAGPDGVDPYAVPVGSRMTPDLEAPLSPLRVGWSPEDGYAPVMGEVQRVVAAAATALEGLGCRTEQVSLPWLKKRDYLVDASDMFATEIEHYAKPLIKGRESELAHNTTRLLSHQMPTFPQYLEKRAAFEELKGDAAGFFRRYDVLLGPTSPLTAHAHGEEEHTVDGQAVPRGHVSKNTVPWDLTGSPALAVPFGWSSEGMPIGVQLVGRHFEEGTLLRVGAALERAADDPKRRPPL